MLRETNKDQSAIAQAEKTLRARCKEAAESFNRSGSLHFRATPWARRVRPGR